MQNIVHWLTLYRYALLFPLAIVEGPVLAVIVGWLSAAGGMRLEVAFPVIVAGDVVGDSACYLLGRITKARHFNRLLRWLGFTPHRIGRFREWFRANPIKTISLAKLTPGMGPVGIFLTGQCRIPYKEFLPVSFGTSTLQYFLYLGAGMLVGHGYLVLTKYLSMAASLGIGLAVTLLLFLFIRTYIRKL